MPSPRALYLGHIADCLKRIKKTDGYNTDAGSSVTLEPAPNVASDADFITVVWARQARGDSDATRRTHRLTTVDIVAKVAARYDDAQARLDDIVSDIETALTDQQFRYPVGYQAPQYLSAEPLAAAAADGWVGAIVTVAGHIPIR